MNAARLSGLAALYCDRARLLPVGIALSDYLDVLVDPEDPRALPALAQGVRELPEWAECSLEELPPRAAALAHAIEAAVAEGCQEFHFLRGGEHYKYEWGAVDRCSVRRVLSRQAAHA